jgi:hypothetical protein
MSSFLKKLLNKKIKRHSYVRNLILSGAILLIAISVLVYGFLSRHDYVVVTATTSTLSSGINSFKGTLSTNSLTAIKKAFGYLEQSGGSEMTEACDLSIIGINIKSSNNGTLVSIQSSGQFNFEKPEGSFSVSTLNSKLQPVSTFRLLDVASNLYLSLNLSHLPKQYQNYEWTQVPKTDAQAASNILYYLLARPDVFIKALNNATSVINEGKSVTQGVTLNQYSVNIDLNNAANVDGSKILKQIADLMSNPVVSFNVSLDNTGRVRIFKFKLETSATQSSTSSTSTTLKSASSALNFGYEFEVGYGIAAFGVPFSVSTPSPSKVLAYSIYSKYLNSKS